MKFGRGQLHVQRAAHAYTYKSVHLSHVGGVSTVTWTPSFEMERRKLYNRVPARLPSTTRWRYANSVREHSSVTLEDSLSFAEALLSNESSHVEGGDDIDSYFEEPSTLTGIKIAAEFIILF